MNSMPGYTHTACDADSIERLVAFTKSFLQQLTSTGISYAVMHHADDLGLAVQSDVDIALGEDPRHRLIPLLKNMAEASGFFFCHQLYYEVPRGYYLVLVHGQIPRLFLHIDCLYDPLGINRYFLTTDRLLEDVIEKDGVREISAQNRALYLVVKRARKRSMTGAHVRELGTFPQEINTKLEDDFTEIFGKRHSNDVKALLASPSITAANAIVARLHRPMMKRFLLRRPVRALMFQAYDAYRKACRFIQPTGLFIIILGPDGSGKSTVAEALCVQLARGFRGTMQFHWRPGLLPKLSRSTAGSKESSEDSSPALVSEYGSFVSFVRFVYYWLDFVLGYWIKLYPERAGTTCIIGERYFPDVMVHPARYGFSLPAALMRFFSYFVPNPDLIILLQDDPEAIHRRKAELTVPIIAQQIDEYEQEAKFWGDTAVVKTDKSADMVAHEIGELILKKCAQRTAKRSGWTSR